MKMGKLGGGGEMDKKGFKGRRYAEPYLISYIYLI